MVHRCIRRLPPLPKDGVFRAYQVARSWLNGVLVRSNRGLQSFLDHRRLGDVSIFEVAQLTSELLSYRALVVAGTEGTCLLLGLDCDLGNAVVLRCQLLNPVWT